MYLKCFIFSSFNTKKAGKLFWLPVVFTKVLLSEGKGGEGGGGALLLWLCIGFVVCAHKYWWHEYILKKNHLVWPYPCTGNILELYSIYIFSIKRLSNKWLTSNFHNYKTPNNYAGAWSYCSVFNKVFRNLLTSWSN